MLTKYVGRVEEKTFINVEADAVEREKASRPGSGLRKGRLLVHPWGNEMGTQLSMAET